MTLGQRTVVLGENGAGKSQLLKGVAAQSQQLNARPERILWVHGTRSREMPIALKPEATGRGAADHPEADLADRVRDALRETYRLDQKSLRQHSQRVWRWRQGDGHEPEPPTNRLRELFDRVSEVLPHLRFVVPSSEKGEVQVFRRTAARDDAKGAGPYAWSDLSDGEKEVVLILADIALRLAEERNGGIQLALVDEPERSLHPGLANRLWRTIEAMCGEACRFVYTTHSVRFATRAEVDQLYFIHREKGLREISGLESLDLAARQDLLAHLPMTARGVLFCEGTTGSLDHLLYSWLIEDSGIAVVPAGNCDKVLATVGKHRELWEWAGTTAAVVDRDHGDGHDASNVHVLPYHEAESYLCHPEVLEASSDAITEERAVDWLLGLEHWFDVAVKKGAKAHLGRPETEVREEALQARAARNTERLLALLAAKGALHLAATKELGLPRDTEQLRLLRQRCDRDALPAPLAKLRTDLLALFEA